MSKSIGPVIRACAKNICQAATALLSLQRWGHTRVCMLSLLATCGFAHPVNHAGGGDCDGAAPVLLRPANLSARTQTELLSLVDIEFQRFGGAWAHAHVPRATINTPRQLLCDQQCSTRGSFSVRNMRPCGADASQTQLRAKGDPRAARS